MIRTWSTRVLHLGERVARDEDGLSVGRELAEEAAQPTHALGVEPVGGLVEDQKLGIPEQGAGKPQPLTHSEGVATHATSRGAAQLDQLEHRVDPLPCGPLAPAERPVGAHLAERQGESGQVVAA